MLNFRLKKTYKLSKKIICIVLAIILTNFWYLPSYADNLNAIVKATSVNIRSGPGVNYGLLGQVSTGYTFVTSGEAKDKDGYLWYKFSYNGKDGYIRSDFLRFPTKYIYDANFENYLASQGFPESYKVGLREVHAEHPNWLFTLYNTSIDFDYAVENELLGARTLVNANAISSFKSTDPGKYDYTTSKWTSFDGSAWNAASREAIMYYLDPRNFFYDPYIFQFEEHTFNANLHTIDGVKEMVKGTFLDSTVNTSGLSGIQSPFIGTPVNENPNIIGPFSPGSSNNNQNSIGPIINEAPTSNGNNQNANIPNTENGPNTTSGNQNNNQLSPYSVEQYGPGYLNGIVVPILENTKDVYGFTNVIYGPGATVNNPAEFNINNQTAFAFTYLPEGTYTYADLIYDACRQVNANPYVIVSMILQEQGKDGRSDSISGTNKKFPNVYNYGNVNAFTSNGLTAVENGLKFASEEGSYNRPWNSKEKGIYGICDFYANSYIKLGQDTFYLKKWNVQGENMFTHQYMTNVAGAQAEAQILASAYDEKMKNIPHEFKIPIYNNMPDLPCPIPTKTGSPNNKLKSLSIDNFTLTPAFNMDIPNYTLIVTENTKSVKIKAVAYDSKASITGAGTVKTETTNTLALINVAAENGDVRTYAIGIYRPGVEDVKAPPEENILPNLVVDTTVPNTPTYPNIVETNININNNTGIYFDPNGIVIGKGPGE